MHMDPTLAGQSARGFFAGERFGREAEQTKPATSAYESAASNWARARDQMERAMGLARAAIEEHEKAIMAEGEAWQAMLDVAGRGPKQERVAQDAGKVPYTGPDHRLSGTLTTR